MKFFSVFLETFHWLNCLTGPAAKKKIIFLNSWARKEWDHTYTWTMSSTVCAVNDRLWPFIECSQLPFVKPCLVVVISFWCFADSLSIYMLYINHWACSAKKHRAAMGRYVRLSHDRLPINQKFWYVVKKDGQFKWDKLWRSILIVYSSELQFEEVPTSFLFMKMAF